MAIIFGSDAGIRPDPIGGLVNKITGDLHRIKEGILSNFSRLTGEVAGLPPPPPRENVYVDDGFSNVPGTSFPGSQIENIDDFKKRRVTSQEPKATIYIQKRAFRALRNEHDTRFMDSGEKLLLRATKILFENKCNQIAAYESLTKVKTLLTDEAELDAARVRVIADILTQNSEALVQSINDAILAEFEATGDPGVFERSDEALAGLNDVLNEVDKLSKITLQSVARSAEKTKTEDVTTWVVDPENADDLVAVGRGSGTIEFTLASSINTSLNLDAGNMGNFSFSVVDPYNLTKITADEIEVALAAAYKEASAIQARGGSSMEDLLRGPQAILREAQRKERELNRMRKNRINEAFSLFGAAGAQPSVLSGGDASEIVFTINPASLSGNRVTISSTASTEVFDNVNYFRLSMLQLPIEQALTYDEDQLVNQIFTLLTDYVTEVARLSDDLANTNSNPNVEYARRKMRLYYVGKNIVQPMDTVHIFMRSNTFKDGQVIGPLSGLLNGHSFVQAFQRDANASDAVIEEEMRQFGLDSLNIPTSVYRSFRTSSFLRNAGIHVFGGLVSTVTESFSAGSGYTINVSGESNMKWLSVSQTNISPSLDQRHGVLEDPLTPFDFSSAVDPATGLIKEDPPLLPDNQNNPNIRFNSGIFKGEAVTSTNIKQDQVTIGDTGVPIIKHAPGLTYRWKEGIIVVTLNNNLSTALGSSANNANKLKRDMGINLTVSPFVSMDAADIISVLVTGFPHNYDSFIMNTQNTGAFTSNTHSNTTESFFHSFFDITRSTNRALGNFQPYKMIKVTPEQAAERLKLQTDLRSDSKEIQDLRLKLAQVSDQINNANIIKGFDDADPQDTTLSDKVSALLNEQRAALQTQLDEKVNAIYATARNASGDASGLRLYGNDLGFEFEREDDEDADKRESFRRIRLRNNLRAVRSQLDVKYNNDNNLFIVSDDYDKDLDIQAFALQMAQKAGPDLFKSSYKKPLDLCIEVAGKLNFEFFCDTQGHLQFRPPQYNKTPLSLLLKMFLLDRTQNRKLYPSFLESLFQNKSQKIQFDLEVVQYEIDINNILLGFREVADFPVAGDSDSPNSNIIVDEGATDPIAAKFLLTGANANTSTVEDLAFALINSRNFLAAKTGQKSTPVNDETLKAAAKEIDELNNPSAPNVNSRRLVITNKLAVLLSKREKLMQLAKRFKEHGEKFQAKPYSEVSTLGNKSTDRIDVNSILLPFADLVEDDYFDDLGPGSSQRFIITDEQILDYDFTESDKNVFMRVEVTGEQDLIGGPQGQIGQLPVIAADATDFDLWRMYGYRSIQSQSHPYFKDAETQCAPYAMMLLNRARRDIVTGSITVAGNEYYQLGDVVYINSRDLLYYVNGVRHNFSYDGGRFTTTLDLKYGHPLGDYIPTPLDVIGKNLVKNQTAFNKTIVSRRTSGGQLGVHLGVVVFPFTSTTTSESSGDALFPVRKEMLSGGKGGFNIAQLKDALMKARKQMNSDNANNPNIFPRIEVRGYMASSDQKKLVTDRMRAVAQWLTNPTGLFIDESDEQVSLSRLYTEVNKIMPKEIYNMTFDSSGPSLANENDPIDIVNPSEDNILLSRIPKEEVYNVATSKTDLSNVIEIVLLLERPRARGAIAQ